ncbi:hypothetical protein DFH06DRAFT_1128028 [Mycena polygramma]|nr:hypothetical protein DFH06DRAFT_1128028 [Mycena polygramma]
MSVPSTSEPETFYIEACCFLVEDNKWVLQSTDICIPSSLDGSYLPLSGFPDIRFEPHSDPDSGATLLGGISRGLGGIVGCAGKKNMVLNASPQIRIQHDTTRNRLLIAVTEFVYHEHLAPGATYYCPHDRIYDSRFLALCLSDSKYWDLICEGENEATLPRWIYYLRKRKGVAGDSGGTSRRDADLLRQRVHAYIHLGAHQFPPRYLSLLSPVSRFRRERTILIVLQGGGQGALNRWGGVPVEAR